MQKLRACFFFGVGKLGYESPNNAIAQSKKAIGCDPAKPDAFDFLGQLQETLGDFDSAIKNYRVAISLDPTYQPAKEHLNRATSNSNSARPSL